MHLGSDESRLIEEEFQRLRSRSRMSRVAESVGYGANRLMVRSLRIAFGAGLACVAYAIGSSASDTFDKPIASLSLRDLVFIAACVIGAVVVAGWAFATAFGEGPKPPLANDDALRLQAETTVMLLMQQREQAAAAEAEVRTRTAKWYRFGRVVGALFDPSLAERHRWLPWAATIVGTGLVFLLIAVVSAVR